MILRGNYDHSLDAKNRVSIPAKFRPAFSDGLVIGPWLDPCIAIFTPEGFEQFTVDVIPDLHPLKSDRRKIESFFAQNFFDSDLDSAGRVTLGASLIAHANIDKDVVVGGTVNRIEIWEREAFTTRKGALAAEVSDIVEGLDNAS